MRRTLSALKAQASTPMGRKAIRYTLVSVIAVAVSQVSFVILFGLVKWTAKSAAIAATSVGGLPSYYLNRKWVWGKSGKSHVWREVVPFWAIAFIGLVFSTWASDFAETYVVDHDMTGLLRLGIVTAFYLGSFGVLWVGKFIVFNKFLFVHADHDEDPQAALAHEVV